MSEKKVTFQDIANYTNFSKTTISRYFNNPDSLTLENQQKIADALRVLNYKENKVARILASGHTEFVGVLIPNFYNDFYPMVLEGILNTYNTYGYKFIVFSGSEDGDTERRYIEELLAYRIEGLIVLSHTMPSAELASFNIPIVSVEREDRYIHSVNTDNYMGGTQAAALLYKNDCDVLMHINPVIDPTVPGCKRITGFVDICREHGVECRGYDYKDPESYEELSDIISGIADEIIKEYKGKRKGMFFSSDTSANLMLNCLFRKYGKLPDDFRIVGFDNAPISTRAVVPISTVGQQVDLLVDNVMELLSGQIEETKKRTPKLAKEPIHRVIAPVLLPRATAIPVTGN
jgi:LacI family sucrose operon transcriptional repressor